MTPVGVDSNNQTRGATTSAKCCRGLLLGVGTVLSSACSSQMSEIHSESSWPPSSSDLSVEDMPPSGPLRPYISGESHITAEAPEEQHANANLEVALADMIGFPFRGVGWLLTQIF